MYLVTYQIILGNLNKFDEKLNVAGQKVLKIDENVFFLPKFNFLLAHSYLKCIIGNHD